MACFECSSHCEERKSARANSTRAGPIRGGLRGLSNGEHAGTNFCYPAISAQSTVNRVPLFLGGGTSDKPSPFAEVPPERLVGELAFREGPCNLEKGPPDLVQRNELLHEDTVTKTSRLPHNATNPP